ncbi:MAG: phosphoenolpyruvate--protein phosphotransferase [Candidatus Omnitrophica bacterium]|nr:phosphoenolpyruvate--protein phosphotransferase [Candidatus Omnitrophota bacterium]
MKRDHSKLLCDLSELTALFTDTTNLDGLLQKIVDMIALHMDADVCSVYLYYEDSQELVLKATHGLNPESINKVRLKLGEGLTGVALKELRPVSDGDAVNHPGFRHFDGIGEEKFASFVAVPIMRGQTRVGAMTLQSIQKDVFTPDDVNVFRAITSQMATTIEMTKLLMSLERPAAAPVAHKSVPEFKMVKGRIGAEGFALGPLSFVTRTAWEECAVRSAGRPLTLADFHQAVLATEKELKDMQQAIEEKLFDVASLIFSAQILMLKDQAMLGAMEERIRKGVAPEQAVTEVVREYAGRFDRMTNQFLREKKYDVMDVGSRLLNNLVGVCDRGSYAKSIVVARELLPSDALKLSTQGVLGLVLLSGGVTSHVAVLARSLNIPLVIADEDRMLDLIPGTRLLLDASLGNIYIDPSEDTVRKFQEKEALKVNALKVAPSLKDETRTQDGVRIKLLANINLIGDVAVARQYKAEGIGLYRTEFPFMVRSDFPTEEEQYVIYRRLVESMKGAVITFRTLDIGGDKVLSYYDDHKEANPFLGLRSIRFSLKHREIFVQQVRAILRAGHDAPVRIMFPMIASVDEFTAARGLVDACIMDLKAEGIAHQSKPVIGIMVELPSAVEMIDDLAQEAAFFSVGTNDLIQYTLAVDRTNEKVADMYLPYHPAVLRSLKRIADAALKYGREISVCGDMAHEARYMPFFVGIGIHAFSLDARYLPRVQERLLSLDSGKAKIFSEGLLRESRVDAVLKKLETLAL